MYKEALIEGLTLLSYDDLLARSAAHMARRGEWAPGMLRPSLLAMDCRLARVKTFLGHAPQPGATFDHARGGEPDASSNLVMARGGWMEAVVVTALDAAGVPIVLRSPDAVRGQDVTVWEGSLDVPWRYEAHPDLIVGPRAHSVQIKCPSDRALSYFAEGRSDTALARYGPQILAELYIMELADWEPDGATLLMVSAEPWPPSVRRDSPIRAFELEFAWGPAQRAAIQARIEETKGDILAARRGDWPEALPLEGKDGWPCSYCRWPRQATFTAPHPCDEAAAWNGLLPVRVADGGRTIPLRVVP